jgi:hypothetical protein
MDPEPATSQTHDFICEECFPPYSVEGKSDEPPKAACERCGATIATGFGRWLRKGDPTRKKMVMEGRLISNLHKDLQPTTNFSLWLMLPAARWLGDAVIAGPGSCFIGKRVRITVEVIAENVAAKDVGGAR